MKTVTNFMKSKAYVTVLFFLQALIILSTAISPSYKGLIACFVITSILMQVIWDRVETLLNAPSTPEQK